MEWHYVVGGHCGFRIADQRIQLRSGDLFLITPETVHGIDMASDREWLLQYIVTTDVDPQVMEAWNHAFAPHGRTSIAQQHGVFARINQELASNNLWQQQAAQHRFNLLISALLGAEADHEQHHPAVAQALITMHERLRDRIELKDIAQQAGVDRHYLARIFKREIGETPMQYYTGLQMQTAAALLKEDDRTISEIARPLAIKIPFISRASSVDGLAPHPGTTDTRHPNEAPYNTLLSGIHHQLSYIDGPFKHEP